MRIGLLVRFLQFWVSQKYNEKNFSGNILMSYDRDPFCRGLWYFVMWIHSDLEWKPITSKSSVEENGALATAPKWEIPKALWSPLRGNLHSSLLWNCVTWMPWESLAQRQSAELLWHQASRKLKTCFVGTFPTSSNSKTLHLIPVRIWKKKQIHGNENEVWGWISSLGSQNMFSSQSWEFSFYQRIHPSLL